MLEREQIPETSFKQTMRTSHNPAITTSIFISEQETQSDHLPHQNARQERHLVKSVNMKYTFKDIYTSILQCCTIS